MADTILSVSSLRDEISNNANIRDGMNAFAARLGNRPVMWVEICHSEAMADVKAPAWVWTSNPDFTPCAISRYFADQWQGLSENLNRPGTSLLPFVWNESAAAWDSTADLDKIDSRRNRTLALFLRQGGVRIIGIVLWSGPVDETDTRSLYFHSEGLRLLSRLVASLSAVNPARLSTSERECLTWSARGRTSAEIGQRLGLSEHTVNHCFGACVSKLRANTRTHAVARAIKLGFISLDEIF